MNYLPPLYDSISDNSSRVNFLPKSFSAISIILFLISMVEGFAVK